ncbi:probable protein phosphatase 2C 66 [Telopea speciosissima]|uniref:probable protein phosphatase 2C 66 n=1 Tax=Telopea speciosissima TaxID=54955 RepID=UPI001CC6F2AC|nr:probable protein phosphatase 2C 66 [Telopea speciosissima]
MGSCYSSRRKRDVEEALDSLGCSSASPTLSRRWNSWILKNNPNKKRKNSSGDPYTSGSVDFSFLGKIDASEQELHRIAGRMFVNGASDVACLFTQQGRKGTNQDAMLVWENFSSRSDTILCGVFDGHGPYGHMVAKKVRDSLPLKLSSLWKVNSCSNQSRSVPESMNSEETASTCMDEEWCESLDVNDDDELPEMYLPLKQSLLKAFKLMDKELKMHPTIDCFCSGTTAVTLVKQGQDLVLGNLGDSRAVLGTRDDENNLAAVQLTVDLKPNLPGEAARIQQCKGRVFALQDEPEVARVWLPNNDSPGLAMARAFGDFCLKDFGLISVPDVSYRRLTERDEFIVLATDGVWDVLSNKEVVDIVGAAPSRATAARALVDCAVRAWKLKFPTSRSDDCAVVCLFLEPPSSVSHAQEESALANALEKVVKPTPKVATDRETGDGIIQNSSLGSNRAHGHILESFALQGFDEIVPVSESTTEKLPERCSSAKSLAEYISTPEDEEWSALEGITRVNSLLNLPRFLSGDRTANWRKWL